MVPVFKELNKFEKMIFLYIIVVVIFETRIQQSGSMQECEFEWDEGEVYWIHEKYSLSEGE
jgi:hypothetical protein